MNERFYKELELKNLLLINEWIYKAILLKSSNEIFEEIKKLEIQLKNVKTSTDQFVIESRIEFLIKISKEW